MLSILLGEKNLPRGAGIACAWAACVRLRVRAVGRLRGCVLLCARRIACKKVMCIAPPCRQLKRRQAWRHRAVLSRPLAQRLAHGSDQGGNGHRLG